MGETFRCLLASVTRLVFYARLYCVTWFVGSEQARIAKWTGSGPRYKSYSTLEKLEHEP